MKRSLRLLSFVLLALPVFAAAEFSNPSWLQRYGNAGFTSFDKFKKIGTDTAGNIYVAGDGDIGNFDTPNDIFIAKYNNSGVQQWVRRYNGPQNREDRLSDMVVTADGRCFLIGMTEFAVADTDSVILCYDNTGFLAWSRVYNNSAANGMDSGIAITADDTYVYAAIVSAGGAGNENALTQKLTYNGGLEWERTFDRAGVQDRPSDILVGNGFVHVVGSARDSSGESDAFVKRYGLPSGTEQTPSYIDNTVNPGEDFAKAAVLDPSGNVYLVGDTQNGGSSPYDIFTARCLANGTADWMDIHSNVGWDDEAVDISLFGSDGVVIVGTLGAFSTTHAFDATDLVVKAFSLNGVSPWTQTYNGVDDSFDRANGVFSDVLGNLYVHAATIETSDGNEQATALRYDPDGTFNDSYSYGSTPFAADVPYDACLDRFGNYIWAGSTYGGSPGSFEATVSKVYQLPVGATETYELDENSSLTIAAPGVLANDHFAQFTTAQLITGPSFGSLTLNPNGSFTYIPNSNFRSSDSFFYRPIRGSVLGLGITVNLNVVHRLSNFTMSPTSVVGGNPTNATVTVTGPANPANVTMTDNSSAVFPPNPITVPLGETSVTTQIGTAAVSTTVTRQVTASFNGRSITRNITLTPATLSQLLISPSSVIGGVNTTGEVRLTGTVTGPTPVALSDDSGAISTPATVTVGTGQANAFFTITTSPVTATATRHVTATLGSASRTANLTLNPGFVLTNFVITPNSVMGGTSTTGTVTISGTAPGGGISVAVADNSSAITTPASVLVPAGSNNVSFSIGTSAVSSTATRTVTCSLNSTSRTANLTLTP